MFWKTREKSFFDREQPDRRAEEKAHLEQKNETNSASKRVAKVKKIEGRKGDEGTSEVQLRDGGKSG